MIGRLEQWLDRERDQLALWLPVALGFGIAGWFLIPARDGWIGLLLAMAGGVTAAIAILPSGRLRRAIILFQLLAAAGCLLIWWRAESVAAPRLERPVVTRFDARIETIERLAARNIVRLTLALTVPNLPERVRVNVNEADAPPTLQPGMHIDVRARLMPPMAAALPGAYDFQRVAWFRRLGATGTAIGPVRIVQDPGSGGFTEWMNGLRTRLTGHIQRSVGGSAGGIAAAFVTGDQGGISEEDTAAMRASGLAHLLSISGLNVSAVVGGAMWLALRLLALSPTLALRAPLLVIAAGVAAFAGVAYTLLAGAEVPTVRSCIAALLVLVALAMGREAMTLRLVATGALVVLVLWPEALVSPSFQLSFAAVTALIAFHEHPRVKAFGRRREEEGVLMRGMRAVALLLATGLVVELALTPIALFHFHNAGLYGAIANMIAIPLTTFIIMPAEAAALCLDLVGVGDIFWVIVSLALKVLISLSHYIQSQPGSVALLPTMPDGAFALMLIAGLWLCLWRGAARWLAVPPFLLGACWAVLTPYPDLLVTGNGRHVAVRAPDGRLHILRPRSGDYVRDMIGSVSAQQELSELDAMPLARCNDDLCRADIISGERRWRLLATRSPYLVPWKAMIAACAGADIVVSDRRLPQGCTPHWLKADRVMLARTGGLAIQFDPPTVATVRPARDDHPWLRISPASYPR